MRGRAVVLSLCSLVLLPSLLHAADGGFDPSFGGTGTVTAPFDSPNIQQGGGFALSPDGKVLVAAIDPSGLQFARYDTTGTLDASFGTGGLKTVTAPAGILREIAVLPSGKILVLTSSVLARYDAAGDPDGTYGSGGAVTLPSCGGSGQDLVVQQDDAAVVSRRSGATSCVARFTAGGSPDTAFGVDGVVTFADYMVVAMAIQGDRLLLGGAVSIGVPSVRRLLSDGTPDGSFSSPQLTDAAWIAALHVQPDGTIFAADNAVQLVRLSSSGKVDTSFGVDGVAPAAVDTEVFWEAFDVKVIAVQPDGRIVVGLFGSFPPPAPYGNVLLVRHDVGGTVDGSFGTDGVVTSFGSGRFLGMAMQPDGKIIASGMNLGTPLEDGAVYASRHFGTTVPCPPSATSGCHAAIAPLAGSLRMDAAVDPKAKLKWSWQKGAATMLADFGDPIGGDDYTFCLYDESSGSVLATGAVVPGGGLCKGKPCWKASGTSGFVYKDPRRNRFGISSIKLKGGIDGKAKVSVQGQGATLPVPTLPAGLPLRVQLFAANGQCWESVFSTTGTTRNDAERYQGKSD